MEPVVKVIALGDSLVGKTSLLVRFADSTFNASHMPTLGLDTKSKTLTLEGSSYKVQLWDTAGQERFRTISYSFYSRADAVLLVYDLTNEDSLQSVRKWMAQIQEKARKDVAVVLVGNKLDLESDLLPGERLAASFSLSFFATSAKTGQGVDQAITALVTEALKKTPHLAAPHVDDRMSVSSTLAPRISRGTSCCK